jgi:6-phosphogluconolactonase
MATLLIYIGTYTAGASEGIYVYSMDTISGKLEYVSKATGIKNPSFLALHPSGNYLYSVNEVSNFDGQRAGALSAFAIDADGGLSFLNQQSSGGALPCHLVVDQTGQYVLAANYNGGSVCMVPIRDDGSLGTVSGFVQHEGSSVDPERQQEPHAHSINLSPDNRLAFAPDLGTDQIMIYALDLENGKLNAHDPAFAGVDAGGGPRHFTFHPNGRFAYVINEMGNTITTFAYEPQTGALSTLQTLPTLPDGYTGDNHTADIHVHPNGKFLYGSNRGHDSIAIYAIDSETGTLEALGQESTRGEGPRNFMIDPSGTFLLAGNGQTDTVVTFRINQESGALEETGHVAQIPSPVCLLALPR